MSGDHHNLFRDEIMAVEPVLMTVPMQINDWNTLVHMGEVPLMTNTHHTTHPDDSYFNFDMKI